MKKRKQDVVEEPVEETKAEQKPVETKEVAAPEVPSTQLTPSDELQIYYNEAYLREKQRFNDMFGIIESERTEKKAAPVLPAQQAVDEKKDDERYVPVEKYVKQRKRISRLKFGLAITITLTVIFAIVVICNTTLF